MKNIVKSFALLILAAAVTVSCVGCGGGSSSTGAVSAGAASVKLGSANTYDQGVTFAAPAGWEEAHRQSKIIVKFDNPKVDGQSVFVKTPEKASIEKLMTAEDAKNSGLSGEMVTVGDYVWMRSTQKSRDSKTEDVFDNLNCKTVQFGKVFTVTVRGYKDLNENADGVMNSVLSAIKISEKSEVEEPAVIDENTDFNVDL